MLERNLFAKGLLGASLLVGVSTVGVAAAGADECVDSDGDGWGWDGAITCIPDGSSGQGDAEVIEDLETSKIPTGFDDEFQNEDTAWNNPPPLYNPSLHRVEEEAKPCIDSDGDGWGWDGFVSCVMEPEIPASDGSLYEGAPVSSDLDDLSDTLGDAIEQPYDSGQSDTPGTWSSFDVDYVPPNQMSRWDPDCEATNGTDWRLSVDRSPHSCDYSPDNNGVGAKVYMLDSYVDLSHDALAETTIRPIVDFVDQGNNLTALNKSFDGSVPEPTVRALAVGDPDSDEAKRSGFGSPTPSAPDKTPFELEIAACDAGHGTKVASLLASEEVGVASGVTVAPVRVTFCHENEDGKFEQVGHIEDLIKGLEYVRDDHVSGPAIVNLSLGVPISPDYASQLADLDNILTELHDDGVLVVSAAGNSGEGACNSYPAAFEGGLTVGGLSAPGRTYGNLNKGPCVDLYAPTSVRVADDRTGGYGFDYGTSLSAAVVSGLAAIHWSENPDLTVDEVIANMKFAADHFEEEGTDCGGPCLSAKLGPSVPVFGPDRTIPTRVE